jgi:hypothetical protein
MMIGTVNKIHESKSKPIPGIINIIHDEYNG